MITEGLRKLEPTSAKKMRASARYGVKRGAARVLLRRNAAARRDPSRRYAGAAGWVRGRIHVESDRRRYRATARGRCVSEAGGIAGHEAGSGMREEAARCRRRRRAP